MFFSVCVKRKVHRCFWMLLQPPAVAFETQSQFPLTCLYHSCHADSTRRTPPPNIPHTTSCTPVITVWAECNQTVTATSTRTCRHSPHHPSLILSLLNSKGFSCELWVRGIMVGGWGWGWEEDCWVLRHSMVCPLLFPQMVVLSAEPTNSRQQPLLSHSSS